MATSSVFQIGDLVWAKVKGFAAWPARVVEENEEAKPLNDKKPKQCVLFYGTNKYSWVHEDQIWPYLEKRSEFVEASALVMPSFKDAVAKMELLVKDFPNYTPLDILIDKPSTDENVQDSTDRPRMRKRPVVESPASQPQEAAATSATKPKKVRVSAATGKEPMSSNGKKTAGESSLAADGISPVQLPDILTTPSSTSGPSCGPGGRLAVKIGFLGLGKLGSVMARQLIESGHDVTVWNRTPSKCREFVNLGAVKGLSPAEIVQTCDITISCLSDSNALKDLVSGGRLLEHMGPGKSLVDMSTCDTDAILEVQEMVVSRGGRFLEAPVIGSLYSDEVDVRQLIIVAAGDESLYQDCYSCFTSVAKRSFYIGEVGSASCMKLVANQLLGTLMAGIAECLALAEKVGLNQEVILQTLSFLPINCELFQRKGTAMIHNEFNPPQLSLENMQRDLRLAIGLAESVEQPTHVTTATNELFKRAKSRGYGDHDTAAIYRATE